MGGSATTSNTAGNNNNQKDHNKRQGNLQKNINKIKSRGGNADALIAKKNKEAKQFIQNTQGVQEGKSFVSNQLGLTQVPNTPPPGMEWSKTDSATSTYASNLKGKNQWYYGEEASKATDDYLRSIGEMGTEGKDGIFRGNNITAQGRKLKYGMSGGAMGSGDPSGILSSTAISGPMWQTQQKIKNTFLLGAAVMGVPLASTALFFNAKKSYGNYVKGFYDIQQGKSSASMVNKNVPSLSEGGQTDGKAIDYSPDSNVIVQDATQTARELKQNRLFASLKGEKSKKFLETSKQTIVGGMARV